MTMNGECRLTSHLVQLFLSCCRLNKQMQHVLKAEKTLESRRLIIQKTNFNYVIRNSFFRDVKCDGISSASEGCWSWLAVVEWHSIAISSSKSWQMSSVESSVDLKMKKRWYETFLLLLLMIFWSASFFVLNLCLNLTLFSLIFITLASYASWLWKFSSSLKLIGGCAGGEFA